MAEDTRVTVTGRERDELTAVLKERYEAGESIRALAAAMAARTGSSIGS